MKRLDLRKIDTEHFLEALEVRNLYRSSEEEWQFSCPFTGHAHGDMTPSCRMNDESTAWFCHGCKRRGNAITFLSELEGVGLLTARRWIREEFDQTWREPEGGASGQWRRRFREEDDGGENVVNPPQDEALLERFHVDWADAWCEWDQTHDKSLGYLFNRGFSPEVLMDWNIGWDDLSSRWTIPVRDEHGRLVGIKGRTMDPNERAKYKALGDASTSYTRYGFPTYEKSHVIFGLDRCADSDDLVLCEGELNVIALHQMGVDNAVGIAGSYLSDAQARLLVEHADRITVFMDDDKAGFEAMWGWVDEKDRFHPGIWEALSPHITLYVVKGLEGRDAADFLEQGDRHKVLRAILEARPASRERYDLMVR